MRLFSKNKNKLFDSFAIILSTEEILLLIPEFEKLVHEDDYTIQSHFEDSEDKKLKNMFFRLYDIDNLTKYDEQTKNIILEKI